MREKNKTPRQREGEEEGVENEMEQKHDDEKVAFFR